MPLTRPRFSQFDTTISSVSDPVTVLNKSSTLANIDVGFIINRNGGALANTAIFWNESANTFALAFTTSTGEVPNANISISTYANLRVNTLNTTFVNATGNVSASQINSATAVVTGSTYVGELYISTVGGDEGGQINLGPAVTNTTLVGNVTIDVYQNKLRIWEGGGTNRGGYFDLSGLGASVSTNLAGGGGGTPGGGDGQLQFNSSGVFAGTASLYYFGANGAIVANAGIASTSITTGTMQITGGIGVSGNVWADRIHAGNNGNGTNFRVGDDLWLGDINVANTMRLMGQQDNTQAFIRFGNTNTSSLGVSGSGPLSWGGVLNVTGNILAANINAGGVRQTTGTSVPTIASVGDQWYDTATDILFKYTYDGTNFIWVDIGSVALNTNIATIQGTTLSITGNGTVGGNLTVSGFMVGKSTQALYADLAENYASDNQYEPGTVLIFGGPQEVTQSTTSHDPAIAGVVSTNPAYLMNSGQSGVSVALTGRVPCWVRGPINKGDRVVSSDMLGIAERLDLSKYQPGCIIGKSLETIENDEVKLIEVVVGRI